MSKSLESQVWKSALGGDLKPIAAVMADMGNDEGVAIYPSVAYLAWLLGCSERKVQFALKKLEELGVLTRIANAAGGRGLTPDYKLSPENLPTREEWKLTRKKQKGEKSAPIQKGETFALKGEEIDSKRVKNTTQKGADSAPDPLVDPLEEPLVDPKKPSLSVSEQVQSVFEYWKKKSGKQRAKLDDDRRRKVVARLKDGYTVKDLKMAVAGCMKSAFHQGDNGSGAIHDDLELICRTAAKVDMFIAKLDEEPSPQKEKERAWWDTPTPTYENPEGLMRALNIPTIEQATALWEEGYFNPNGHK